MVKSRPDYVEGQMLDQSMHSIRVRSTWMPGSHCGHLISWTVRIPHSHILTGAGGWPGTCPVTPSPVGGHRSLNWALLVQNKDGSLSCFCRFCQCTTGCSVCPWRCLWCSWVSPTVGSCHYVKLVCWDDQDIIWAIVRESFTSLAYEVSMGIYIGCLSKVGNYILGFRIP